MIKRVIKKKNKKIMIRKKEDITNQDLKELIIKLSVKFGFLKLIKD